MSQNIIDSSAVLASELLRDASELSHSLFPVVKLLLGSSILLLLALGVSTVESLLDDFTPLIEDLFEVRDHLRVGSLVAVLCFLYPLLVVRLESDVGLETSEGFFELAGELVED